VKNEPDFDAVVEGDAPEERDRLRRVHDLLVAAGPPPELPPTLLEPPRERRERPPALTTLPRRRFGAVLTAAAGVAAAAFVIGFFVGDRGSSSEFQSKFALPMKRTTVAPREAAAVLNFGQKEEGGNIPLSLSVSGLKSLPEGGYYELWLTRHVGQTQKRVATCGTFVASNSVLSVRLNAPYTLERENGWVITRHVPGATSDPVWFTT
jgi:hypothetical protein